MKVGTDGVLLGAWCTLGSSVCRVLDIGTGTGLIALMISQRCGGSLIDALEIDPGSAEEAYDNFSSSPWADRITAICDSLQHFTTVSAVRYDNIVCNPPYFTDSLRCPDGERSMARHNVTLNYGELTGCAARLLAPGGVLSLIVPRQYAETVISHAGSVALHLVRRTDVFPKPGSAPIRSLLEFSAKADCDGPHLSTLVIESGTRNDYTGEYIALTRDFYLKM